jgi:hypothetical protein
MDYKRCVKKQMKNNAHKDKGGNPPVCHSRLDPESRFYYSPIPSLQVKMKQAPVVCEVIPGCLQPRLVAIPPKVERNGLLNDVIPDLIRNLVFIFA